MDGCGCVDMWVWVVGWVDGMDDVHGQQDMSSLTLICMSHMHAYFFSLTRALPAALFSSAFSSCRECRHENFSDQHNHEGNGP